MHAMFELSEKVVEIDASLNQSSKDRGFVHYFKLCIQMVGHKVQKKLSALASA